MLVLLVLGRVGTKVGFRLFSFLSQFHQRFLIGCSCRHLQVELVVQLKPPLELSFSWFWQARSCPRSGRSCSRRGRGSRSCRPLSRRAPWCGCESLHDSRWLQCLEFLQARWWVCPWCTWGLIWFSCPCQTWCHEKWSSRSGTWGTAEHLPSSAQLWCYHPWGTSPSCPHRCRSSEPVQWWRFDEVCCSQQLPSFLSGLPSPSGSPWCRSGCHWRRPCSSPW